MSVKLGIGYWEITPREIRKNSYGKDILYAVDNKNGEEIIISSAKIVRKLRNFINIKVKINVIKVDTYNGYPVLDCNFTNL